MIGNAAVSASMSWRNIILSAMKVSKSVSEWDQDEDKVNQLKRYIVRTLRTKIIIY